MNNPPEQTETPKPALLTAGRKQLLVVLGLTLAALVLWNTILIYPIKVFVVFLHEISHGLAAVLTGGSIAEIQVFENEGGLAMTRGGMPFIITSAGYLGSMLWGGALLLVAMKPGRAKVAGFAIAVILLMVSLMFVRNTFGFFFGVGFALVLGFACLKLPVRIVQTVVQWLGAVSILYAAFDIKDDLFTLQHRQTDAQILADMTGVPAIVWGLIWGLLAVFVMYVILRRAWKRASVS